jgi:cyclopropane-fatty-acyl-phospholipid synthase
MNSRIYVGTLSHARTHEVAHGFDYDLHLFALDLDELEQLDRSSFWFGHNRLRPLALHDRDYLYPTGEGLREKVLRALSENGVDITPARIVLVSALRQFHYVFNPASFFYCLDDSGRLACVLVQVNNTFGETHLYVLTPEGEEGRFATPKEFHVSPFFPRRGRYEFMFSELGEELKVSIAYFLGDAPALEASFSGRARPMSDRNLARIILGHPLRAALTFPRIVTQAARLYFGKKLMIHPKPEPLSPMTIRHAPPSVLERVGKWAVGRFLRRLDHGQLTLTLPDGNSEVFGAPQTLPEATLDVHRSRFFRRVLLAGDIGFGEAYVDGDWSSPDLVGLLSLLAQREGVLDDRRFWPALAGRALNYAAHLRRPNTIDGSRRNIGEHYDLGNDFYRLFLDSAMSYSGGIFKTPEDSLEEAQFAKMHAIIDMAELGPDDHVLEIGCGWGGFALEAVRRTGCRVTGITISRQQHAWATRRVREEGLDDRISIELTDYRHVQGCFSAIVSIEMLEAVGHRNLPVYFAALDRLLSPGGRAVLQVITMPDQKYDAYRLGSDWIRKHIFPGGHLPSIGALARAMGSRSRLNLTRLEDIGLDYARTLKLWRQALMAHSEEAVKLGLDHRFLRKWEYYFSYCEAGFRSRTVRNYQLLLSRMGEPEGACRPQIRP